MSDDAVKKARDAMEAARKKLGSGAGAETEYAEAYVQLCRADPMSRPNRKKYR